MIDIGCLLSGGGQQRSLAIIIFGTQEVMIPRTPRRSTAILTLTLENPYRIELIVDRFIRTEQKHNI